MKTSDVISTDKPTSALKNIRVTPNMDEQALHSSTYAYRRLLRVSHACMARRYVMWQ